MSEHDEQREVAEKRAVTRCLGWCKPKVHANPRFWIEEHYEHTEAGLELILGHWIERPGWWKPGMTFTDGMCQECIERMKKEQVDNS